MNLIKSMFISILLIFTFSFFTCLIAEDIPSFTAQEIVVKNAKWSTPTNGDTPEIVSFEVTIKLDDTHSMSATIEKNMIGHFPPLEYIKKGDQIEIIEEKFSINKEGWSWFKIKDTRTDIEIEVFGNSMRGKVSPPTDSSSIFIANDVRLRDIGGGKNEVSFSIKNVYVSMEVGSARFHGFYERKPFLLLDQTIVAANSDGGYFIIFTLKDLETSEIFEATSLLLDDNLNLTVDHMFPFDVEYDIRGGGRVVIGFKMGYTFKGGASYQTVKIGGSSNLWQKYYSPGNYANKRREEHGNDFMILEENPDPANRRNSNFLISSTKNGEVLRLYGPARKSKLQ